MSLTVKAETALKPTEDEEKVRRALHNLFPSAGIVRVEMPDGDVILRLAGEGIDFLGTLRNLIKQERIRNAARAVLLQGIYPPHMRFYLNKQAAFVGRVSFCGPVNESPNGPIAVEVQAPNLEMVVDFLAARPGEGLYSRR